MKVDMIFYESGFGVGGWNKGGGGLHYTGHRTMAYTLHASQELTP